MLIPIILSSATVCIDGYIMNGLITINVSLFYCNIYQCCCIKLRKVLQRYHILYHILCHVIFQRILQETNDHELSYLFLQRYTHWAGSLFAWPWLLELAWLLAPAKEARRMSSSDSTASVGSSSETFRTASSINLIVFFLIRTKTWKIWLISVEYKVYRIINIVILFHFYR